MVYNADFPLTSRDIYPYCANATGGCSTLIERKQKGEGALALPAEAGSKEGHSRLLLN